MVLRLRRRGEDGSLVDEVLEVSAREARRDARHSLQVCVRRQRLAARVHLENRQATGHVRVVHGHLAVKATGAQQRRVEDVGPVGGRDDDDVGALLEAVHLDQDLVQRLFALVMAAAQAGAAMATDRVDFVDEDDGRRLGLGALKQVAHAAGAHAHEHLDRIRSRIC